MATSLFIMDIIFSFFTAYYSNEKLIDDQKLIIQKYLKTWFAFDILSTIPFDLILTGN